ncbi:hypothetical protein JOD54_006621 [Actinokineospora baliensis]|uniref:hypothetical protein n=1 Tax=Actinokineospora baliensis TaxID=547056 RepID=UPI0019579179|nr:hypothetical protein [Actinokineospora baliensis]MBM7776417.1 hypothetical protein [Actinokineospora baliensis]
MIQTIDHPVFGARFASLLPARTGVAVGLAVTVSGIVARIGDLVQIGPAEQPVLAEVVALDHERVVPAARPAPPPIHTRAGRPRPPDPGHACRGRHSPR